MDIIKKEKIIIKVVIAILALSVISCGIFEPRTSEDPEKIAPWNHEAIIIDQIMENLEYSYNYAENSLKYIDIFTPDFSFQFASQDITEHGTPAELNVSQESEMLFNLHKHLTAYKMTIAIDTLATLENQDDSITNNSATLYRRYYITIGDNNSQVYQGKAEFELILNPDNRWRIKVWKDFRSTSNQTWGKLKNEYTI